MKKQTLIYNTFAFAYALLVAFIFYGCESKEDVKQRAEQSTNDISIIEYDSCEYLIFKTYGGSIVYTHKGNCKFCAERNTK
jgi:hypothetical protein